MISKIQQPLLTNIVREILRAQEQLLDAQGNLIYILFIVIIVETEASKQETKKIYVYLRLMSPFSLFWYFPQTHICIHMYPNSKSNRKYGKIVVIETKSKLGLKARKSHSIIISTCVKRLTEE